ncbi:MAG: class I SAM-dependent DNA methyltransferase [Shimia sp.]
MTDEVFKPGLYTAPRSADETRALYDDWAEAYDADVEGAGYATPGRIAAALVGGLREDEPILDFGCGTGLSGRALRAAGFSVVDGCDISPEMLARAEASGAYRDLRPAEPGAIPFDPGAHRVAIAAGVISAGAAPPETLNLLVDHLPSGGLLAFSLNDPSLALGTYDAALDALVAEGRVRVVSRENGPHLPAKDMRSDVVVVAIP